MKGKRKTKTKGNSLSDASQHKEAYETTDELAERLRTSRHAIYQLVHKRKIPYCKLGKRLLFLPSEVDKAIKRGRVDVLW